MSREDIKTAALKAKSDWLFELSWEVCNKVGGIYTVLVTKAQEISKYYGDNYYLIGPYFPDRLRGEFLEQAAPERFKEAINALEGESGIRCHFGTWLIGCEPSVILI